MKNEEKTALHSNAFNFRSFVQSGVDPRTGLYTVALSLHEVEANDLRGPVPKLSLSFNPTNPLNYGYGEGWSLGLTQFITDSQVISVFSGETFKVTGDYGDDAENPDATRQKMKEQKIQSFKFYELSDDDAQREFGEYKVVHASGLVEVLKRMGSSPEVAMPVKMYSPQGHTVTLTYGGGAQGRMLSTIKDSQGVLLEVIKSSSTIELRIKPVRDVPLAVFTLELDSDRLTRVNLPVTNDAGWRFEYGIEREQLCIKDVWTPLGAHETLSYNDLGHGFPGGSDRLNLPRVTDHVTDPGGGQNSITVKYSYSDSGNNFLGKNSPISWTDDGLDNLYKILGTYVYESTEKLMVENDAVRTVTRTFNRFHLLTSEVTTQGTHRQTVKTTYYADDSLSFDEQVRQCQLPKEVATRWNLTDNATQFREDKVISEYDIHGNQTLSVQANGITETTSYYPADGVPGVWKDPYGFVRHVKEKTVSPAKDPALVPDLQAGAPVLRTRYNYVEQPPLSTSATHWVALAEEQLLEGTGETAPLLERTTYTYFNEPGTPFLHGQPKRQGVARGGANDLHTTFTDYEYSKPAATFATFAGETVLLTKQTLTTDFDSVHKEILEERSLLNGEPILSSDKDVKIRYTYDALGRVLTETVAPDSALNNATRTYTYRLIRPADQDQAPVTDPVTQEVEDVKQVKSRTWLDGLGRPIREQRQDKDNGTAAFRDIYEATYDALGQLTTETEIDWLEKTDLKLTSTFTYDLWGQQSSVTGPDGVKSFTDNNPITFTSEEWVEGMGKTKTLNNRFEKPVTVERFELDGKTRVSLHSYKYDGLARTASEKNAANLETKYVYDAYDRMIETTLPDRNKVVREYAVHSRADLPTLIRVGSTVLGTQAFDGLERMTKSVTGGRVTEYEFEGSTSQPDRVKRPSGDVIAYTYMPELTEEPITRVTIPKTAALTAIESTYDYDPKNARLIESSEQGLALSRTYNSNGEVITEKRTQGGEPYEMTYVYSRLGRLVRYTDVLNQVQRYEYDQKTGQLNWTALGEAGQPGYIKTDFTYNAQGQTATIHTVDGSADQRLKITLKYDAQGRETVRDFDFGASASRLSQSWNGLDQIVHKLLSEGADEGGEILRDEHYEYELRGRLENYQCAGPQSPVHPCGKTLKSQMFFFDAIDNLEEVTSTFADGGSIKSTFAYAYEDPAQLSSITDVHSENPDDPLVQKFEYDENGNLLEDEAGRRLAYDSLGRLESVSEKDGGTPRGHTYDSEDKLSSVGGASNDEQRFYNGDTLVNRISGDQSSTFVRANETLLAEQQGGAGPKS